MKQKTTALIIVGIAAIMLIAINCSGSSPNDTPPIPEPEICECTDKEHLGIGETCCGTDDCTCTLRVYGIITDNNGNVINIYREGTVSETDMAKAIADIQAGYGSLLEGERIKFATKGVDKIYVVPSIAYPGSFANGIITVDPVKAVDFYDSLSDLGLITL